MLIAYVHGEKDLLMDIAFVGTLGGTIWGAAGAILAMGYCAKTWLPKIEKSMDTGRQF